MTTTLLLIAGFCVFTLIIVGLLVSLYLQFNKSKENRDIHDATRYQRNGALMSPAEHRYLRSIEKAVQPEFRVFGKVRLCDFVLPRKDLSRRDWEEAFKAIKTMHMDFLVCEPNQLRPVCAIKIDKDSLHVRERMQRTMFLEDILHTINIPLLRFPEYEDPDPETIKEDIFNAMESHGIPREWPMEAIVEPV